MISLEWFNSILQKMCGQILKCKVISFMPYLQIMTRDSKRLFSSGMKERKKWLQKNQVKWLVVHPFVKWQLLTRKNSCQRKRRKNRLRKRPKSRIVVMRVPTRNRKRLNLLWEDQLLFLVKRMLKELVPLKRVKTKQILCLANLVSWPMMMVKMTMMIGTKETERSWMVQRLTRL